MSTIEIEPAEEPPADRPPTLYRSPYAVISAAAIAALTAVTLVTLHDERMLADRALDKAAKARPVQHVVLLSAHGDGSRLVIFAADGNTYVDPPLDTPIAAESVDVASVIVTAKKGAQADCMITVDGEPVAYDDMSISDDIAYCLWNGSVVPPMPRRYGDYLS